VRACWSTAGRGEGGADRGSHGAARENGRVAKRFSELTRRAREAERERGARARETSADRAAPLGRGKGGACGEKPLLTGGAHLSCGAKARARPCWAGVDRFGLKWFSLFSGNF
jgi:hypothetical protein